MENLLFLIWLLVYPLVRVTVLFWSFKAAKEIEKDPSITKYGGVIHLAIYLAAAYLLYQKP